MMDSLKCRVPFLLLVVLQCVSVVPSEIKLVRFDSYIRYDGLSCPQSEVVFLQTNVVRRIDCLNRCSELSNCWCIFYKQGYCQGCHGLCHHGATLPALAGTTYFFKKPGLRYDNKFYLIVEYTKTWQDAQNYCKMLQATLLYIDTQAELNWIAPQLAASHYWTGGILSDGQFVWSHSGGQINMTLFAPREPNGSGLCVELWSSFNYLLDDYGCENPSAFICKIN